MKTFSPSSQRCQIAKLTAPSNSYLIQFKGTEKEQELSKKNANPPLLGTHTEKNNDKKELELNLISFECFIS
jgi:hypothetical protein